MKIQGGSTMFRTIHNSTISIFDLQNALKRKRRKKIHMGFQTWIDGNPIAFLFL